MGSRRDMGQRDGTFRKAVEIPAGMVHPLAIATADLNGDGHPDAVLVNGLRPSRVAVLLGDGTGGFRRSAFPGGHRSQWVIAADLDGDGIPDVATANAGGGVSVLLGTGSGRLRAAVGYSTNSTICSALTAADLNEDGNLDLVTTNSVLRRRREQPQHLGSARAGDGTFQAPAVHRALGYQPTMAATADVDGDGHLDVVASMGGWPGHYVTVLLRNGTGMLQSPELLLAGPSAHDTVAADLNGDGPHRPRRVQRHGRGAHQSLLTDAGGWCGVRIRRPYREAGESACLAVLA
jgi:hypothetical protein